MTRRLAAAAAFALCVLGAGRAAQARLVDFRAGLRGGGLVGWGADSKTPDFFNNTSGLAGGFEVGAKLLIFDASVNFLQMVNGNGLVGTLTQFQLGIAIDVPLGGGEAPQAPRIPAAPPPWEQVGQPGEPGEPGEQVQQTQQAQQTPPPPPPPQQAAPAEPAAVDILRPSLVAGFGFGTPGPVHGALTNDEISDKGLVATLRIGYEHFLNPFLGVGVEGDVGYHYFLGGQVVTSNADHSSGVHLAALGTLTFHLGY